MPESLGSAIRRLRLERGATLRGFAEAVGISAAHQSDIEHGRRLPSDAVLREIARALTPAGGVPEPLHDELRALDARLDPDVQAWVQREPAVGQLLREVMASGRSPRDVLRELQRVLGEEAGESDERSDEGGAR